MLQLFFILEITRSSASGEGHLGTGNCNLHTFLSMWREKLAIYNRDSGKLWDLMLLLSAFFKTFSLGDKNNFSPNK